MLLDFDAQHALLLQGPNGPFFRRFAAELEERGTRVTKVNFNAADGLFFRGPNVISFREPMERWPTFLRELLVRESIDAIFLFGDCRPMHRVATRLAGELGIRVFILEEGYLRPHWITIEEGGVNGNSRMSKDPDFYRRNAPEGELPPVVPVGHTFAFTAAWTILNSMAVTFFARRYPHYRHHRDVRSFRQAGKWARGFARKLWHRRTERELDARVAGEWSKRYFFVPLQVHCDAQIGHSRFAGVDEFIAEVVASFARSAPPETLLLIKHHPMDLAYRNYARLLDELGARHGCGDRIVYVHEMHLPTLLRNALGTVTINSTVGLSSLQEGTPVKVLGAAIYDMPELTCQRTLDAFFADPGEVDAGLVAAFSRWLRQNNQVNGSFYKRLPGVRTRSGLNPAAARAAPVVADAPASTPGPRRAAQTG